MKPLKTKEEKMYYIQSGYVGNAILWWAKDSKGYTTEINKAGKYTKERAKEIIQTPQHKAWECNHIDKTIAAHKHTIDAQYLNRRNCLIGRKK